MSLLLILLIEILPTVLLVGGLCLLFGILMVMSGNRGGRGF